MSESVTGFQLILMVASIAMVLITAVVLVRRYALIPDHGIPQASPHLSAATYNKRIQRSKRAISVTDLEGRFVMINARKVALLRLPSVQDVLGKFPWDFAPPNQPSEEISYAEGMKHINFAAAGAQPVFEWVLNDREGHTFSIEVSLEPIELADGTYVRAVAREL